MYKFFVRHKLDILDITHLSDSDSEYVINELNLNIEDIVQIETYEAIYLGVITHIEKNSVEVEIREKIEEKERLNAFDITLIQSLMEKKKFNFFLEKCVEIGIDRILPIESQYSLVNCKTASKEYGLWKKIVMDATEQSRNISPTIIEKPIKIDSLDIQEIPNRICLATENTNCKELKTYLESIDTSKPIAIAIGPEKGWSSKDINIFKNMNFTFIKLKGNILRTETVGLTIGSILKYIKEEI